jgi:UDP-N-acetylglucosamine--N-acetylmuramyl-(pentapeptide) pyrophosphoryl-undecaprenol N-acetylglucosamine transferase
MGETILIAAGGTGGHLFPGIAVADELRRRDPGRQVVFVGTPRGLESRLLPRAGYPLELLPILPLNRVGLAQTVRGLLALPRSLLLAVRLVRRARPGAVLGVGGYAGGPVTLVAALLGVRTVILEPNARPGFTNRVLRPFVRHAACAYEATRGAFGAKGVLTGNPVRGGFARLPERRHEPPFQLLAFGGSQGSSALNQALLLALPMLPGPDRLRIVHQTGPRALAEVQTAYQAVGRPAEVVAFLDDMEDRLGAADLVLSRSGATTCAELQAAGRAALLVPFAQAADDHQRVNARAMLEAGAALVLDESALSGETLADALRGLLDAPERLAAMGRAARRMARPDAAARVADLLEGRVRDMTGSRGSRNGNPDRVPRDGGGRV